MINFAINVDAMSHIASDDVRTLFMKGAFIGHEQCFHEALRNPTSQLHVLEQVEVALKSISSELLIGNSETVDQWMLFLVYDLDYHNDVASTCVQRIIDALPLDMSDLFPTFKIDLY